MEYEGRGSSETMDMKTSLRVRDGKQLQTLRVRCSEARLYLGSFLLYCYVTRKILHPPFSKLLRQQ